MKRVSGPLFALLVISLIIINELNIITELNSMT